MRGRGDVVTALWVGTDGVGLQTETVSVSTASDVEAALDRLDGRDCLVVGPDCEVVEAVETATERSDAPVFACADGQTVDDAFDAGAADVLTPAEVREHPVAAGHRIRRAVRRSNGVRERALRRRERRLEAFASVVSHDLRNPMHVASGHVNLARETGDLSHLDTVAESLERMDRIVEDVLTLVRGGSESLDRAPVNLDEVVRTAWATVDTQDATLVGDVDATVEASRHLLRQVFENLFRNAVLHGGDDVTVRVGKLGDEVFVEDDGPGIPADERERVLELGYTTADDGTGLGLPIVARLVSAHDWTLRVEEGTDGGARIRIAGVESA